MAYTMAVNRHITPKPGHGWRVWAAWWTLVIWLPPGRLLPGLARGRLSLDLLPGTPSRSPAADWAIPLGKPASAEVRVLAGRLAAGHD
jgi:hypothetical protein